MSDTPAETTAAAQIPAAAAASLVDVPHEVVGDKVHVQFRVQDLVNKVANLGAAESHCGSCLGCSGCKV
jgi:hypothetical protein